MIKKIKNQKSKIKIGLLLFAFFLLSLLYPNPYTLTPASADWIFDATPPTCSISSPASPTAGTPTTITITYSADSSISPPTSSPAVLLTFVSASATTSVYSWTPAATGTTYTFSTTPTDLAGNVGAACTLSSTTCVAAGTIPACRTTGGSVPNGACGTISYTANAASFADTCAACHTNDYTITYGNGDCTDRSCPNNARPAGIVPACRTTGGSVPDGACGTISYTANAASFADTCAECHTNDYTITYGNGNCTDKSCPANAPPAESEPLCHTAEVIKPDGDCTTTTYPRNCTTDCVGDDCRPGQPTSLFALCRAPGNSATLSWTPPSPTPAFYNVRVNGILTLTSPVYGLSTISPTIPGSNNTWDVSACRGGACSSPKSGPSFFCNYPAWIQTTGGDIHSNIKIKAPGGP